MLEFRGEKKMDMTKERIEEEIKFCEYYKKEIETRTLPAIKRKIKFYKKMLKCIEKKK